jgi:preprotein translocase subunit YajC
LETLFSMFHLLSHLVLLAEEAPPAQEPSPFAQFMVIMIPVLLFMIVMQMFFGRSDAREKTRREQMLASLKKNDPVVTIGGILGTVVSVSEDKSEVTIKVDDNTRLKLQSSAIRQLPRDEAQQTK